MSLSTVEERVRAELGVRLFTVLKVVRGFRVAEPPARGGAPDDTEWVPERSALRRVHSSHPAEYPVGGEKTVEVAAGWLDRCITAQEPYFGPDRAAVREIFADHELIESLGCGSIINVPVVSGGRTLGVLNILDAEGAYDEDSVAKAESLAPLAVPALLEGDR